MTGDHQFLVGRDYPGRDSAGGGGDPRGPALVCLGVELETQPSGGVTNAAADLGGVLANASGEDQSVDSAEHGGEGADLLGSAIHEIVDSQAGSGGGASEEIAHIVADAGNPEQTGLFVEDLGDFFRA